MEYNNQSNESNESPDSQGTTLRPIGYFYTTTFTISPTFIDRLLLLLNNQQNIPMSSPRSPYHEQNNSNSNSNNNNNDNDNDNEIWSNSPNSPSNNPNLYYNPIIFNSSNLRLFNTDENNEESYYDLSNTFFPTVNFIERIFNDYIENKNKLNDEEYKNNVEKIHEILEECPVCFSSSETTIKIKKCNHVFCEDCIQKWLKSHKNTCPICRVNVIIEPENSNGNNNKNSNE